jgi:hypothetical protein
MSSARQEYAVDLVPSFLVVPDAPWIVTGVKDQKSIRDRACDHFPRYSMRANRDQPLYRKRPVCVALITTPDPASTRII